MKKKKVDYILIIAILVFIASGIAFVSNSVQDHKAKELNEALALKHHSIASTETRVIMPESEPVPVTIKENLVLNETTPISTEEIESPAAPTETTVAETSVTCKEKPEMLPSMKSMFIENKDTVGWIKLGGTKIDNVVVQAKDNDYYLHRNFYKEDSLAGTIFADYRCSIFDDNGDCSDNIILYGHKQRNGTMFGTLHNYKNNLDFYKDHPTFTFSDLYNTYTYKIVSAFVTKTQGEEIFDYQNFINFDDSEYSFEKFASAIKRRSQYSIPVEMNKNDKFLTLSTCSYEYNNARFVVVARRVREGEDPNVDTSYAKATNNPCV